MWICPSCHYENRDTSTACENCGAAKAVGRFGSAPTQHPAAPRVRSASAPAAEQPPVYRPASAREQYQPPETGLEPPPPPRSALCVLGKIIGTTLLILLPVLAALFAWRQYDAISQAVLPLLLGENASEIVALLCYIALAVVAGLICTLPGLWTLLLCRRPPKPWRDKP